MEFTILTVALIVGGYLALQRWFWVLLAWFSSIASLFAMVASIVSFQILWAMGFFVLAGACYLAACNIAE